MSDSAQLGRTEIARSGAHKMLCTAVDLALLTASQAAPQSGTDQRNFSIAPNTRKDLRISCLVEDA